MKFMALPMWTQSEIVDHLAEVTGFPKGEIRNVLAAQAELVQDVMANCERIKLAEITIEPKMRKATKKRMGRNPATGEEIEISAKPASVVIKARVGKKLQDNGPNVQKLRKALA
jgi:nucleoid DNA-binding protein